MIEKTETNRNKACLAVACNGWKECNECDFILCEFHPDCEDFKNNEANFEWNDTLGRYV